MKNEYNTNLNLNYNKEDNKEMTSIFFDSSENTKLIVSDSASASEFGNYSIEVTDTKIEFMQNNKNFFVYNQDGDDFYLCTYNIKDNVITSNKISTVDGVKYTYETYENFSNLLSKTPAKNMCCELFKQNMDILNQIIEDIKITKGEDISETVFNSKAVQELDYKKIYIKK